jgi:diguanylate cyclase (GGDEF)-like protein
MMNDIRVLYVEDDTDIAEEIAYFLQKRVKELYIAKDGQEGYELYKKYHPDVILTDIQMPVMNGLDMSEKIRQEDSDVPIIIISAYNDTNFLTRSIALGVTSYITKPINLSEMAQKIQKAYETQALKQELKNRNKELESMNKNLDAIVEKKTKDLEFLYYHDSLTSLYNSVALEKAIEEGSFSYLVLLDIANFSYINKQYGKLFGNRVLATVAELLKAHCNTKIRLYKIESDRFVFLLSDTKQEEVEEFCEQIQSFFDTKKFEVEGVPIGVAFNIGIASSKAAKEVLIQAEYALDIAKKLGARYYAFYNEKDEVIQQNKQMIEWLNITKEMIEGDMIVPYFQPILDSRTNKIVKFEVLARGIYKEEVIAPVYFIDPATRLGLISSITRIMIQKSFSHFTDNSYEFSLNISERDLHEAYLYDYLNDRAKDFNIEPSRVTLEILESVTTGLHHEEVTQQINKIKSLGFKVAIDDFGTENANFSRLMHINFDYIKLDGTFMKNIDKSQRQQLIVKSIVELARVLGIETIAEFIESETICHIARECGVDMMQGYYLGKPQEILVDNAICKEEQSNE